ncbi:type 1 fimbrial protein [Pantoea sp. DY-15]|uniref:fimbrial protein n=1 Tax=unclassified Pantoea TaxID=2630326 RepID=UPI001C953657|nr:MULTISPECIES: fimbrial protein [unclassified Pantoea]MBY4841048.1 type 1 fimbrial protein [Pantoea sp. DY-5]MBY4891070.1 type 1 fimbrial protein [Pantoea sp. DY-15]
MKFNKIVVALGLGVMITASLANAAISQGGGTVTIKGSIIDAPCSINPGSQDQTIDLGQVSKKQLAAGGKSTPVPFNIKLENCDFTAGKDVKVTFTAMASEAAPTLIGMTGTVGGASIGLTDGSGKLIKLGQPSTMTLQSGSNTLSFSAYLQGDGPSATITPGVYQSTVDFGLDYQ